MYPAQMMGWGWALVMIGGFLMWVFMGAPL